VRIEGRWVGLRHFFERPPTTTVEFNFVEGEFDLSRSGDDEPQTDVCMTGIDDNGRGDRDEGGLVPAVGQVGIDAEFLPILPTSRRHRMFIRLDVATRR
jgi:hypothetical protein